LAAFWAETLGYQLQDPPDGFESWEQALEAMDVPPENRNDFSALVDPEGPRPRLLFQRVPEPKQTKNRVHLDIRTAPGLEGEARMAALEAEAEAAHLPRRHPAQTLRPGSSTRLRSGSVDYALMSAA
jgi:hypothetical protein